MQHGVFFALFQQWRKSYHSCTEYLGYAPASGPIEDRQFFKIQALDPPLFFQGNPSLRVYFYYNTSA